MQWERSNSSPGNRGILGRGHEHEVAQTHKGALQPSQDHSRPWEEPRHRPGRGGGKWSTRLQTVRRYSLSRSHKYLHLNARLLNSCTWRPHSPHPRPSPAKADSSHPLASLFGISSGTASLTLCSSIFSLKKISWKWERKSLTRNTFRMYLSLNVWHLTQDLACSRCSKMFCSVNDWILLINGEDLLLFNSSYLLSRGRGLLSSALHLVYS